MTLDPSAVPILSPILRRLFRSLMPRVRIHLECRSVEIIQS